MKLKRCCGPMRAPVHLRHGHGQLFQTLCYSAMFRPRHHSPRPYPTLRNFSQHCDRWQDLVCLETILHYHRLFQSSLPKRSKRHPHGLCCFPSKNGYHLSFFFFFRIFNVKDLQSALWLSDHFSRCVASHSASFQRRRRCGQPSRRCLGLPSKSLLLLIHPLLERQLNALAMPLGRQRPSTLI